MKKMVPDRLKAARLRTGAMASDDSYGLNGAFVLMGPCGTTLRIVSSTADYPESCGWEHVSVSPDRQRTPNWQEMTFVKKLFWDDDECVVQFHPPESDYVNCHPYCLHLWKHVSLTFPTPPSILVGPKQ